MRRVLCSATVDRRAIRRWRVDVTGEEPFAYKRTYTIETTTEDKAAMEGIRLFVEEMENLAVEGERWQAEPEPMTPGWIDGRGVD